MAFNPDTYLASKTSLSAPTVGGFDPDAYLSSKSPTPPVTSPAKQPSSHSIMDDPFVKSEEEKSGKVIDTAKQFGKAALETPAGVAEGVTYTLGQVGVFANQIIGDVVGLGGAVLGENSYADAHKVGDQMAAGAEAYLQPETAMGKSVKTATDALFGLVPKMASSAGHAVAGSDHPVLGAVTEAAINVLAPVAGIKGYGLLKSGLKAATGSSLPSQESSLGELGHKPEETVPTETPSEKEATSKIDYLNNPPKDYHAKDAIEAKNWAINKLKTENDEDSRASLHILVQKASEVIEGDQSPSVRQEHGITIKRNGNYIDSVEVPKELQKTGLGTKIVQNLEHDISKEGHKEAFVLAKPSSVGFWKKQGYKGTPKEGEETVQMSKSLVPPKEVPVESRTVTPEEQAQGKSRLAFHERDAEGNPSKIVLDPEAIKESWDSSTPENKPWIKAKFSTPEAYQKFVLEHEKAHTTNPQQEGETHLDYENRINEIAGKARC